MSFVNRKLSFLRDVLFSDGDEAFSKELCRTLIKSVTVSFVYYIDFSNFIYQCNVVIVAAFAFVISCAKSSCL